MTIRKIIKDLQEERDSLDKNGLPHTVGFCMGTNEALPRLRTLESDILRILAGERKHSRLTKILFDVLGKED